MLHELEAMYPLGLKKIFGEINIPMGQKILQGFQSQYPTCIDLGAYRNLSIARFSDQ